MTVIKGYHCVYEIHYHFVFPVKYRKAIIDTAVTTALKQITYEIQNRYGIIIDELGVDTNHVHLIITAHPKYAPGQIVRLYKSVTSQQLFKKIPELQKELWGGEFWTDGYYIGTISQKGTFDTIIDYVKKQGMKPEDVQLRLL